MSRDKVIQVQKKAQSLEQFQRRAAGEGASAVKVAFLSAGAVVVALAAWGGWSLHRQRQVDAFEARLATIRLQVDGDGVTPVPPDQLQARMQGALPQLEALAKEAPASRRAEAEGLLATWKLELTGQGGIPAATGSPMGRLREAQRLMALGQGKEAKALLDPIRAKATEDASWGQAYWVTLLEADRLNGDRNQGEKDLGDYRARFKDAGGDAQMEKLVQSI
ncbi:MAG: hypothetical protein JST05_08270 [Acidobacteria bacterium]|nr:hypothetical protein [Acidobacteriota bacterium]